MEVVQKLSPRKRRPGPIRLRVVKKYSDPDAALIN